MTGRASSHLAAYHHRKTAVETEVTVAMAPIKKLRSAVLARLVVCNGATLQLKEVVKLGRDMQAQQGHSLRAKWLRAWV